MDGAVSMVRETKGYNSFLGLPLSSAEFTCDEKSKDDKCVRMVWMPSEIVLYVLRMLLSFFYGFIVCRSFCTNSNFNVTIYVWMRLYICRLLHFSSHAPNRCVAVVASYRLFVIECDSSGTEKQTEFTECEPKYRLGFWSIPFSHCIFTTFDFRI